MNRALFYLWFSLVKRGVIRGIRKLRHPSSAIGIASLAFAFGLAFHFRHEEFYRQIIRAEVLAGCALVMLCGSMFKGFLQRGLVFQLPDTQFLFTGPFTRPQIVFYRLLPNYLYSIAQAAVFVLLFAPHLKHPALMFVCLTLFQAVCFHIAAGAAVYAGTLSDQVHDRIRWMMLATCAVVTLFYLRAAWGVKLMPVFLGAPLTQMLFYPAADVTELGSAPWVGHWGKQLVEASAIGGSSLLINGGCLGAFILATLISLSLLLRFEGDLFEPALASSSQAAERRARLQSGEGLPSSGVSAVSAGLPRHGWFYGARAIVWKNLIVARRSRRELFMAGAFAAVYIGFLAALRWVLRRYAHEGGGLGEQQVRDFDMALIGMLAFLAFLLQRSLSFDLRRDGRHLVGFRALPIGSLGLVLAELAVPVSLCLALQTIGLLVLVMFGVEWRFFVFLLAFPAVALGLNGVWNVHYLLAATRRTGGKAESASPITLLMIVALSFLIFYPAGWLAIEVGRHITSQTTSVVSGASVWLATQYAIDFLVVALIVRLLQRFETPSDS
jgi:hypothetical protein